MYKNILFDLGNVLINCEPEQAFKKLANYMNTLTAMLILAKKKEFLEEFKIEQDLLETGKMNISQFFSRLKGKIGLKMSLEDFESVWCSMFSLNNDVVQFAKKLSENYKIYILSNTNESHINYIFKKFPVFDFVSGCAFSHELGALKPSDKFFLSALEKFNISPKESLFIDDSIENVRAAENLEIKSFKYENLEHLKNKLAQTIDL